MNAQDYIDVINDLNQELRDAHGELEVGFNYTTNGDVDFILFREVILWCSEDSEREWIEDKNEYEPFKPFIKRLFNEWAEELFKFRFPEKQAERGKLLLNQDDCAPDSLRWFEKDLKEKYNLTINDFKNKGESFQLEMGGEWRYFGMILSWYEDDPFYNLHELIEPKIEK